MGNTALCIPYATSSIKVIDHNGKLQEYMRRWPMSAAQLMLENPGQFVCDSNHLKVGCRIPGLVADDELEPRHVYFLLPMDLLYSVLTDDVFCSLSCEALAVPAKRGYGNFGRKIFPVLSDFCLIPSEIKKVVEAPARRKVVRSAANESWRRSWKPALDTIQEDPCMM